jgi:hypothetical protein
MDDYTNLAERTSASLQSPVLVIIQHLVLTRTCLINILKREFIGFEILELATTADLDCLSGRDVRLVALDIGDRTIVDPSIAWVGILRFDAPPRQLGQCFQAAFRLPDPRQRAPGPP